MPLWASVYMCLVVTCWERADLLALVCGVQLWVCQFPIGFLGQVWYLIVSIPDLCSLSYFVVSYKWKCVTKNWLTVYSQSCPGKSVVRWPNRPDMTIAVDWDVKNQIKQKTNKAKAKLFIGICYMYNIWASAWHFQQCGMCDQQSLGSACTYAQSDQSLC